MFKVNKIALDVFKVTNQNSGITSIDNFSLILNKLSITENGNPLNEYMFKAAEAAQVYNSKCV